MLQKPFAQSDTTTLHIKFASSASKLTWLRALRKLPADPAAADPCNDPPRSISEHTSSEPPSSEPCLSDACSDKPCLSEPCSDNDETCCEDDGFAWSADACAAPPPAAGDPAGSPPHDADHSAADTAPRAAPGPAADDEAERARWSLVSTADGVADPLSPAAVRLAGLGDWPDPDDPAHAAEAPARTGWLFGGGGGGGAKKAPGLVMSARRGRT
jgi:hypothetical protein